MCNFIRMFVVSDWECVICDSDKIARLRIMDCRYWFQKGPQDLKLNWLTTKVSNFARVSVMLFLFSVFRYYDISKMKFYSQSFL